MERIGRLRLLVIITADATTAQLDPSIP